MFFAFTICLCRFSAERHCRCILKQLTFGNTNKLRKINRGEGEKQETIARSKGEKQRRVNEATGTASEN